MKLVRTNKLKLKKGMTLIETIIVMGIIGVIAFITLSQGQSVGASQKISSESQLLANAVSSTQSIYASAGYSSVTSAKLAGMASFPNPMKNNAKDGLVNSWDGTIDITGAADGETFDITYNGIPDDVCEEFRLKNAAEFSSATVCEVDSLADETQKVTFTSY